MPERIARLECDGDGYRGQLTRRPRLRGCRPWRSLTRVEAAARAALIDVTSYDVDLDLDSGERTLRVRGDGRGSPAAEPGRSTFLDVRPEALHRVTLNGSGARPGRRSPTGGCRCATCRPTTRSSSPRRCATATTARACTAASTPPTATTTSTATSSSTPRRGVFALLRPARPQGAVRRARHHPGRLGGRRQRRGHAVPAGQWTLATTQPLSTYFVTVCAGPYVSVHAEHDGIPLGIHARASLKDALERHADQMLEVTRQSLRLLPLAVRHPVPVRGVPPGVRPGVQRRRDGEPRLRDASATSTSTAAPATRGRAPHARPTPSPTRCAHMWFGDLVTMTWWDDLWLNESFAEYMSHRTPRRRDRVHRRVGRLRRSRARSGATPPSGSPSTHPVAGSPAPDAAVARCRTSTASPTPRARRRCASSSPTSATTRSSPACATTSPRTPTATPTSPTSSPRWSGRAARTSRRGPTPGCGRPAATRSPSTSRSRAAWSPRGVHRESPADRPGRPAARLDVAGFTDGAEVFRVGVADHGVPRRPLDGSRARRRRPGRAQRRRPDVGARAPVDAHPAALPGAARPGARRARPAPSCGPR